MRKTSRTIIAGTATLALAAGSLLLAGPAQAGSQEQNCRTAQNTFMRGLHVWETKPVPKKGYKNTFSIVAASNAVALTVKPGHQPIKNPTEAVFARKIVTTYTTKNRTPVTLTFWSKNADQWCDVYTNLYTK